MKIGKFAESAHPPRHIRQNRHKGLYPRQPRHPGIPPLRQLRAEALQDIHLTLHAQVH